MTTYLEPFTTSLALTWSTVAGGALSVSGGSQGTLSGADTRVRAEHDVGSTDMFTQVTWVSGGTDTDRTLSVMARCASGADTAYILEANSAMSRWQLLKVVAGSFTSVSGGTVSRTITLPITVRLECQGTAQRCYLDSTLVGTYGDTDITTGQRGGIAAYNPGGTQLIDDFSTGALSDGGSLRIPIQITQLP